MTKQITSTDAMDIKKLPVELRKLAKGAQGLPTESMLDLAAARIDTLQEALEFYANHNHWMAFTDNSARWTLVAMASEPEPPHGWQYAEKVLG